MTKVLILGGNGMLGSCIVRYLQQQSEYSVACTVRSKYVPNFLGYGELEKVYCSADAMQPNIFEDIIEDFRPDWIINCIGIIKQVDQAKEHIPIIEINSLFPHKLSAYCDKFSARLIHFSTDCVFSGSAGNYNEADVPDAIDLYGRTKLLGEVQYKNHVTFRTSIIGHGVIPNKSLVDWFCHAESPVNGYTKAFFSGLPTIFIAEFLHIYFSSGKKLFGLYHLGSIPIDKMSLLSMINTEYGLNKIIVPVNELVIDRSLCSNKLQKTLAIPIPSWPSLIQKMHEDHNDKISWA
jgi:dTDP-4-dehydrorhamnose reductase